MKTQDQIIVKTLVRSRMDFQAMRKAMDNRLGKKADGTAQNVGERLFAADDLVMLDEIRAEANRQEKEVEKKLLKVLRRFPIYKEFLEQVKGVGTIAAGWIVGEIDIYKADTVSKIWQYAGLNPDQVRGQKSVDVDKYKGDGSDIVMTFKDDKGKPERHIVMTDEMIKGDRPSPGFVLPYNKPLRTALGGVLADGFIKAQSPYCLDFYYPYKHRLEQSENEVMHLQKMTPWKDVSKGHRDRAAKRYMIKMFLRDLYVAWRDIEGLPVRASYQEEYLGKAHAA